MRVTKARFNARLLLVTTCVLAAQGVAPPAVRVEIDGGFQGKPDNEQVWHLPIGPDTTVDWRSADVVEVFLGLNRKGRLQNDQSYGQGSSIGWVLTLPILLVTLPVWGIHTPFNVNTPTVIADFLP